jgi:hypothetical protein
MRCRLSQCDNLKLSLHQRALWISIAVGALSDSSKSTQIVASKKLCKTASYKFRTKFEESRGWRNVDGEKELARCSREVRVRGRVFHEEYCTPAKSTDNFGTRDIAGAR